MRKASISLKSFIEYIDAQHIRLHCNTLAVIRKACIGFHNKVDHLGIHCNTLVIARTG